MAQKKRSGAKRKAAVRGDLPGQYLKRALVTVHSLALVEGGEFEEHHYIVRTSRLDGDWKVEVEYRGDKHIIPHKVLLQIVRHMDSIKTQGRRDRAIERSEQMRAVL